MQNPLASTTDVTALQAVIVALRQENEYLRWQLAKARRERFGCRSERGDLLNQLSLYRQESIEVRAGQTDKRLSKPSTPRPDITELQRRGLPESLPREEHVLPASAGCVCPACGGKLKPLCQRRLNIDPFFGVSAEVIMTP